MAKRARKRVEGRGKEVKWEDVRRMVENKLKMENFGWKQTRRVDAGLASPELNTEQRK